MEPRQGRKLAVSHLWPYRPDRVAPRSGRLPFGGLNEAHDWDPWSRRDGGRRSKPSITTLDRRISYIDTAPSSGAGNSDSIIGEVMKTRRDDCVLASKAGWLNATKDDVINSIQDSLRRLQTDNLDIVQLHGGMYTVDEHQHIVSSGPLDGLRELKDQGLMRIIGITAEEPWTARPFLTELLR